MSAQTNSELKVYELPYGWRISFPDSWQHEYQPEPEGDQHLFFPEDSDLTFRITSLLVQNDTGYAPIEVLQEMFARSMSGLQRCEDVFVADTPYITDYYEGSATEGSRLIYQYCAAAVVEGHLLKINIFASDHDALMRSLELLTSVCRS